MEGEGGRWLRVVGTHTWLINSPLQQVRPASQQVKVNTSWYTVARGVAGAFAPPWAIPVFDVRLFRYEDSLFATCVCARCPFGVYLVQLKGDVTADGGLSRLRAWVTQKATTQLAFAKGRNQALFIGRRSARHSDELMVQPWLGLTASFGTPLIQRQQVVCHRPRPGAYRRLRVRGIQSCATIAAQEVVRLDRLRNLKGKDLKRLIRSGEASTWLNSSWIEAGFGNLELLANHTPGSALAVPGGHAISSTSHLVRSARGRGDCTLLVGVGHLHRSAGDCKAFSVCNPGRYRRSASAFRWGSQYTHFFYALEARAPFRMLATSNEFCLAASEDGTDCESVQFVSGLALNAEGDFVLSFGVNDCEAKVGVVARERVWRSLQPMPSADAEYARCWTAGS